MTDTQTTAPAWLNWLAQNRRPAAYLLLVLALIPLGLAIWWGIETSNRDPAESRFDLLTVTCWAGALALAFAAAGLYELIDQPRPEGRLEAARMLVLALGGVAGLLTTVAGAMLAYAWWGDITSWLSAGNVKDVWRTVRVILALFGGLGVMFASLLAARPDERSNALLRRLLYGYNTVLVGILLLTVLAVLDAVLYVKFPQSVDFTTSNIYSLSDQSKQILRNLNQPTKIYMIMSSQDPLTDEVRTLLTNCREVNPNVEVEVKSPSNDTWLREMAKKYSTLGRVGLLVVYGEGDSAGYRFIQRDDLFTVDDRRQMRRDPSEKEGFRFKGEDALMTQLDSLTLGKEKTIVYFTQGNGELDLKDSNENHQEGMGLLSERLKKRSLEVKPLNFKLGTAKVPDDATMVVIAGPRRDLPEAALTALREYMNRPGKARGKLLVMLEPPAPDEPQNSLINFLRDFNVDAPPERLLTLNGFPDEPAPTLVRVVVAATDRDTSPNPIVRAFQGNIVRFVDARPVKPGSSRPGPGGSRYHAEPFMFGLGLNSPLDQPLWVEKNLSVSPSTRADEVMKEVKKGKFGVFSVEPVPVAVTVSESDPGDVHAGMMGAPPGKQIPRMVVFGDSTFASNFFVRENTRGISFDLVAGSLDWLREREATIGIPPKNRNLFQMPERAKPWPLTWIPTLLICTAILGLGAGVWVVRRR